MTRFTGFSTLEALLYRCIPSKDLQLLEATAGCLAEPRQIASVEMPVAGRAP